MIVVRFDRRITAEDADRAREAVKRGIRTGVLVTDQHVTITRWPQSPTFRAKSGPTPRWIRRPAVHS